MKKSATLFFLALCSSAALQAQVPTTEAILKRVQKRITQLGPAIAPKPVLKGTAATEQLASEALFSADSLGNLQLADSVRFTYNNNARGQRFDYDNFQYIDATSIGNGGSTNYLFIETVPNNSDSAMLRLVEFDTLRYYQHDATTGISSLRAMEYALYNADSTVSMLHNDQIIAGSPVGSLRQVMTYNSAGQLAQAFGLQLNGSNWDTVSVRTVSYTSGGQVILDSLMIDDGTTPIPSTRQTYYTYNSAGQYLTRARVTFDAMSGAMDTVSRTTNTYYANGQLHTVIEEENGGNGLQLALKDSLWYTPGVPGFTGFTETVYDLDSSVLLAIRMTADRINAQQLKDSMTVYLSLFGFEVPIAGMNAEYNANGNPTIARLYDLQLGTPTLAAFRRWQYYPTGGGNTGIQPRSPLAGSVRVFPNPTSGSLTLDPSGLKPGTRASVQILNMAGQLVQSESLVLQGGQQIDLGRAAAGQYLISVRDNAGYLLCNQQVVKQ